MQFLNSLQNILRLKILFFNICLKKNKPSDVQLKFKNRCLQNSYTTTDNLNCHLSAGSQHVTTKTFPDDSRLSCILSCHADKM